MAYRNRPCAYCGTTTVGRTKGHVIPSSLYPNSPEIQRITVPECTDCKALWEDAEPHFRNMMIATWDPEKVVADSRLESMLRSFSYIDGPKRINDLAETLVSVATPNGQRHMIYPAKDPRCNLILRRIIRGLCYSHDVDAAIADARVWCDVLRHRVPEALESDFKWHEVATTFVSYSYIIIDDEKLHSLWRLRFSEGIEFIGIIVQVGQAVPASEDRRTRR